MWVRARRAHALVKVFAAVRARAFGKRGQVTPLSSVDVKFHLPERSFVPTTLSATGALLY